MIVKTLLSYTQDKAIKNFYIEPLSSKHENYLDFHKHDFYQIIFLEKGSAKHFVDFKTYEMQSPAIAFVFPQQIHNLTLSDDAAGSMLFFDDTVFCSDILANELAEYNVDLHRRVNNLSFSDNPISWTDIKSIYSSIQSMYLKSSNDLDKMQIKLSIKLLILKIVGVAPSNRPQTPDHRHLQLYSQFRKLVSDNFKKERKVSFYSDQLGISSKTLTTICQQYGGDSPLNIIHDALSTEIKQIFLFEEDSLKEIAFNLGFPSQSALNKYIDNKFACTPSELKKKILETVMGERL